jgi:hypothetical protein
VQVVVAVMDQAQQVRVLEVQAVAVTVELLIWQLEML